MNQLPITSRVKRSPLLNQAAGAIEVENDDEGAKGYYESEGADVTTSEEVLEPGKVIKASKERCGIEVPWTDSRCVAYSKMSKEDINASEVKQGLRSADSKKTITTTAKGDDQMDEVQLKRSQKSDVMEPWQISRMQRSIKKEQKQIRKSKLKQRPDGVSRRDWRRQVKAEENAAEQKGFEALAKRNIKARESGKRGGTRDVAGFDRNKSVGEGDDKVQISNAKKAAELAAERKAAELAAKKKSPNGMRKNSPAKKSLVGAQNQLPPQLQASIKAAPGKKKSPAYKMKGSMFQKRY